MSNLINIYDDDQSELIIDNTDFDPTNTRIFHNLGEKPVTLNNPAGVWSEFNTKANKYQNASFVELHIYDEGDNFILTLNSGKPLLQQPSTGKFYFGDYHIYNDTYMTGIKHTAYPHEELALVRDTQIIPYPFDQLTPGDEKTGQRYAIKISEIFEILKVNYSLKKDTKFKFKYAIFGDLFLQAATHFTIAASDNMDIVDQDEPL